jgi:hypothetical protein
MDPERVKLVIASLLAHGYLVEETLSGCERCPLRKICFFGRLRRHVRTYRLAKEPEWCQSQ